MAGAIIIVVVLLLIPVLVLLSGGIMSAILGQSLLMDAVERNAGSELLDLGGCAAERACTGATWRSPS